MTSNGSWRPVPLDCSFEIPTLLSSIETGASDYTVRITDTANLWVESLDFKAIRARGWSEGTSLDPGDSPENMTKLLSCLRAALDTSHKDHQKTSMSLSQASANDAGDGGLTIKISYPLPGLDPLEWPIHLRKASSSTISSALVLPLVQDQCSRAREIESLASQLAQKDAVITKLLDKLEATGTGLEHIFNQLSGKKKATRSAAAEKVKGLAPFDRQQWQQDLRRQKGPRNTDALIREVFEGDNVQQRDTLVTEESPRLDRWWLDLKGTLQIPQRDHAPEARQPATSDSPVNQGSSAEDVDNDDDDFQLQETPPHLVSRTKKDEPHDTPMADDSSTDSEDDELTGSQPAPSKPRAPKPATEVAPKPSVARMGAIGGGKASSQKRSVSPVPATSTTKAGNDSDTASDVAEDDGNETASTADPSPPPSPPRNSTTTKGRLGQIGGQAAKAAAHSNEKDAKPKLGTIGKGQTSKTTEDSTTNTNTETRGRHSTRETNKAKDEPRETSTERADRRREELKKELEKKAAAGPAKKKRKF